MIRLLSVTIDIEIEHRYYHHLLKIVPNAVGKVALTPLKKEQKIAVVKFFIRRNKERIFLKEYLLHLSRYSPENQKIEVTGKIVQKHLELTIVIEGEEIHKDTVKLSSYMKKNLTPLFLVLAGIAALLLLSYTGYRIFSTLSRSQFKIQTEGQPPDRQTEQDNSDVSKNDTDNSVVLPDEESQHSESDSIKHNEQPAQVPVENISQQIVIHFYANSTRIHDSETTKLQDILSLLQTHPGLNVTVEGHCALYGTKEGRLKLSKERADKIVRYLTEQGWEPETQPVILWYGAERPVTTDPTQKDKNRRVEIRITSD